MFTVKLLYVLEIKNMRLTKNNRTLRNKDAGKRGVLLRCPLCGRNTSMPAAKCAHCRADFMTGYRKPRFGLLGGLFRKAVSAVVACSFLGLLAFTGLYIYNYKPQNSPSRPDSFHNLAQDNPGLLRPYVMAHRAREAVSNLNEGLYSRQEMIRQLSNIDGNDLDQQNIEYLRNLSPRQRAKMLKDLSAIINGRESRDDNLITTPGQRKKMVSELDRQR